MNRVHTLVPPYHNHLPWKSVFFISRMIQNIQNLMSLVKFSNEMRFSLLKQSQKSRSVIQDRSRFFWLFWKGKTSYNWRNAAFNRNAYMQSLTTRDKFYNSVLLGAGVHKIFTSYPVHVLISLVFYFWCFQYIYLTKYLNIWRVKLSIIETGRVSRS